LPTCGPNPRISVWRPADPLCPGASCHTPSRPIAPTGAGSQPIRVLMRLSVQASLRLNHAIHQGNHRLDRPLHISAASGNVRPLGTDDLKSAMAQWGARPIRPRGILRRVRSTSPTGAPRSRTSRPLPTDAPALRERRAWQRPNHRSQRVARTLPVPPADSRRQYPLPRPRQQRSARIQRRSTAFGAHPP